MPYSKEIEFENKINQNSSQKNNSSIEEELIK